MAKALIKPPADGASTRYRIPRGAVWPAEIDTVIVDDALHALRAIPDNCIALAVTSPPYWNLVDYGVEGQLGQTSYDVYLDQLLAVWREAERVLIPNGKLAIITPIVPIAKATMGDQHTRHLKNIASDIESTILRSDCGLQRYSLFAWQKQTTVKMFGSYPFPPNIYEDNTLEFINVYVKEGAPPPISAGAKERSRLTQREWLNLSMQVWNIYPEDVKRARHPAPFPIVLPLRLIKMYTFAQSPEAGFEGDVVLDMFAGTGSTLLAAKAAGRRYLGIELNPDFASFARHRLRTELVDGDETMLEKPRVRQATSSRAVSLFDDPSDVDVPVRGDHIEDPL